MAVKEIRSKVYEPKRLEHRLRSVLPGFGAVVTVTWQSDVGAKATGRAHVGRLPITLVSLSCAFFADGGALPKVRIDLGEPRAVLGSAWFRGSG